MKCSRSLGKRVVISSQSGGLHELYRKGAKAGYGSLGTEGWKGVCLGLVQGGDGDYSKWPTVAGYVLGQKPDIRCVGGAAEGQEWGVQLSLEGRPGPGTGGGGGFEVPSPVRFHPYPATGDHCSHWVPAADPG